MTRSIGKFASLPLIVAALLGAGATAATAQTTDDVAAEMNDEANFVRVQGGKNALYVHDCLQSAAATWTTDVANGASFDDIDLGRVGDECGFDDISANRGWGFETGIEFVQAVDLDSEDTRQRLLADDRNWIGSGSAQAPDGLRYYVQFYGR